MKFQNHFLAVFLSALLIASAGCFGSSSVKSGEEGSDPDGSNGDSSTFNQEAGHGRDTETMNETEQRRGSVTGTGIGGSLPTIDPNGHTPGETFVVGSDVIALEIVVTTTPTVLIGGEDLRVTIYPPRCELAFGDTNPPSCAHVGTTEGRSLSWETDDPQNGEWGVDLRRADPGFGTIDWLLEITTFFGSPVD